MTTTGQKAPAEQDLVELTIDDIGVSVPKGTLIIRAAEQAGIQIPRFCDHPGLDPVGACRQCLVEVWMPGPPGPDGQPGDLRQMQGPPGRMKPQASCTMTVAPGMAVKTQYSSPAVDKAQKGVMELLLVNHPLDCPVCDKGGECPLQNQAMSNGRATSRFEDVKRTYPKPVNISSQVLLDRERCVLCARCTRFSDQVAGDPFIALVERGALQQVGIYEQQPFESYFSGNTVQICPVGALTGSAYRFRSRPFDLVSTPSVCEHCASGCAIRTDHRRGTVLRRLARPDAEVNEEWNCDKGRWAFRWAEVGDRVQFPMVRRDGELEVASWSEALSAAADGLRAAAAVAVLPGGRVSMEDAYAYAKFARVALGTNDVDARSRTVSAEESDFLAARVAGLTPDSGAVTYADLESAATVVLVGFEPEDESPIVFLRLRKAFRRAGTSVYAVSALATRGLDKVGGTLVPTVPGEEARVLRDMARAEPGGDPAADSPEPSEAWVAAAGRLRGGNAVILVGERAASSPGALRAAAELADSTGARLAWVPRRAGERGAIDAGAIPTLLPGGAPVSHDAARAAVSQAWGADLPSHPGRDTATILADAAVGAVDALVVGGVDPADLGHLDAAEALRRAFVVALEVRHGELTAAADVVLPVAPHDESAGTYLTWEGRARRFEAALDTSAMGDHRVLDMVAGEMDVFLGTRNLEAVRREMNQLGQLSPGAAASLGAPAVAAAGSASEADASPEAAQASVLAPGQVVLATWAQLLDDGRLQDGEPFLAGTAREAVARLAAATADALGVRDGDDVLVASPQGQVAVPARVLPDEQMVPGVVWLPSNSGPSRVHAILGVDAGARVSVSKVGEA